MPWTNTESTRARGAVEARPGGIDDFELPRQTLGTRRCPDHVERSPTLRELERGRNGCGVRGNPSPDLLRRPFRDATQSLGVASRGECVIDRVPVLAAVGSELRRLHQSSVRARPPLLLLCIDSADGATLAAAAAAVAVGAPALNVCDDAAALGFDGVPRARDGRRLLDKAAGCNAPVVQEIEATI